MIDHRLCKDHGNKLLVSQLKLEWLIFFKLHFQFFHLSLTNTYSSKYWVTTWKFLINWLTCKTISRIPSMVVSQWPSKFFISVTVTLAIKKQIVWEDWMLGTLYNLLHCFDSMLVSLLRLYASTSALLSFCLSAYLFQIISMF